MTPSELCETLLLPRDLRIGPFVRSHQDWRIHNTGTNDSWYLLLHRGRWRFYGPPAPPTWHGWRICEWATSSPWYAWFVLASDLDLYLSRLSPPA